MNPSSSSPELWASIVVQVLFVLAPLAVMSTVVNLLRWGYGWLRERALPFGAAIGGVLVLLGTLLQLSDYYSLWRSDDGLAGYQPAYHRGEALAAFLIGALCIGAAITRHLTERHVREWATPTRSHRTGYSGW